MVLQTILSIYFDNKHLCMAIANYGNQYIDNSGSYGLADNLSFGR